MQLLKIIFIILEVLLVFNLLILVHELGHLLAARWRGLVVERFAIWFGKPLWQKKINGVVYCLGSIPAGGYVALPQMATMEAIEGKNEYGEEQLPPITPMDKIIVALAGPLFSFGLAIVFALIVWGVGRPVSESETTTVIGYVAPEGPADEAGLRPGDKILSVDGEPVTRFMGIGESIIWRIVRSEGDTIPFTVERDGEIHTFHPRPIKPEENGWGRSSLRQVQIAPKQTPMVGRVFENSPADQAGLKPSDLILAIDGNRVFSPAAVGEYVRRHPHQTLTLTVRRGNREFPVSLRPEVPEVVEEGPDGAGEEPAPMIGIAWDLTGEMDLIHPPPGQQIKDSVNAMVSTLGAVFSPKSDIKAHHLSGPVGIMRIYYQLFESEQGWRLVLWFSVILNVNLAILNMLPIPVLDGGHITLAVIEGVRRRPISAKIVNAIQSVCALLIIGYMLYITFFDVHDLPWKREPPATEREIRFTPSDAAERSE
jgi:regulator of sigma E protease